MTEPLATVLYVEDDLSLSFVTQDNLEQAGFRVVHCAQGREALRCLRELSVQVCVLDIMLPEMDGFALVREIRQTNTELPIILLTAKSLEEDKITGLTLGADDYLTKPFSMEELILKIKVFLRRSQLTSSMASGVIGRYTLDAIQQTLIDTQGNIQRLTYREAQLLHYLIQRKNQLLKREDILRHLWKDDDYFAGRSLDVFISRLRKYLQADPTLRIENVHGVGFRLVTL